jgi:hypothetical protein
MDIGASWIDRVHRRKGWSMNGYHIVIRRDGTIEWSGNGARTRPYGKSGSHVGGCGPGWNQRAIGICLIGGVKEDGRTPEANFTDAQFAALHTMLKAVVEACDIPWENVMGHRDLIKLTNAAPKACPCFSVREMLNGTLYEHEDDESLRLSFSWNSKLRPPPQRGEKLKVHRVHTVKEGDTLWSISRVTGVPVRDIRSNNRLETDLIKPGQKLRLIN